MLNEKPIAITPEPITGRMLLAIPKGDFSLRLGMDYWHVILGLDPRTRLPLPPEQPQPQRIELDEAGGVFLVVGAGVVFEGHVFF